MGVNVVIDPILGKYNSYNAWYTHRLCASSTPFPLPPQIERSHYPFTVPSGPINRSYLSSYYSKTTVRDVTHTSLIHDPALGQAIRLHNRLIRTYV